MINAESLYVFVTGLKLDFIFLLNSQLRHPKLVTTFGLVKIDTYTIGIVSELADGDLGTKVFNLKNLRNHPVLEV